MTIFIVLLYDITFELWPLTLQTERQAPCEPAVRYFRYQRSTRQISLNLTLDQPGCYHVLVTYNGTQLKNSEFHVILLNRKSLNCFFLSPAASEAQEGRYWDAPPSVWPYVRPSVCLSVCSIVSRLFIFWFVCTVKPVFKGQSDERTPCEQGIYSKNDVLSCSC